MSLTASSYNTVIAADNGAKLYLGNWASTSDAALTGTLGAVINCTKAEHATLNEANKSLTFMRIDMPRDGLNKFERSFALIDASLHDGKNVLVHCAAGACRSAALVLYYLMRKNDKWSLAQAHAFLKSKRSAIAALDEDSLAKYTTEIDKALLLLRSQSQSPSPSPSLPQSQSSNNSP
jgi:predicted protein tyrosine phosphatase